MTEALKRDSRGLRGTIVEELANSQAHFSASATGVLKFHGIYQQDDRDLRKQRPERAYSAMVRVGIPGGRLTAEQYLELDRLADDIGAGALRITSRQDLQYHYVSKHSLAELIAQLHAIDLTTLAACGDVVRNVVACAAPIVSGRPDLWPFVTELSRELKPRTRAYFEIWLDGERAASLEEEDDPLYGDAYLPRKFKIGFAHEGDNTTDIYSHDLGFVAHSDSGALAGFTMLAGGSLGQSNGVRASHPWLADPIGFVRPERLLEAARAAVSIHRDFGDRENRRLARLKYVIEKMGVEWFRLELERRLGESLAPARRLAWRRAEDYLGWHLQGDGRWFYGVRVISGRIVDTARSGIREIVDRLRPEVRLTAQQNLLFAGIAPEDRSEVDRLLHAFGIARAADLPPMLRHSMACPALPTCGQAVAESERVWPDVARRIQLAWDAAGLGGEPLCVRMTGCANGCARPYTAEVGIVGQSADLYCLYVGGSPLGTRLAELFRDRVRLDEIAGVLEPLFEKYSAERSTGERFGDWATRQELALVPALCPLPSLADAPTVYPLPAHPGAPLPPPPAIEEVASL
ncbi:MAG TPA: NADPH-dependent assimilatory sulfite reductase hemoprotein subunit [Bryobacteraceae bacterium]|jgi:sulfite reductase (ferredoxin)